MLNIFLHYSIYLFFNRYLYHKEKLISRISCFRTIVNWIILNSSEFSPSKLTISQEYIIINFTGYGFDIDFHGCRSRKISIARRESRNVGCTDAKDENGSIRTSVLREIRPGARFEGRVGATIMVEHKFSFVPAREAI